MQFRSPNRQETCGTDWKSATSERQSLKNDFIKNVLNMTYRRERNKRECIAVLGLQFTRLASTSTELDDSTNVALLIVALKNCSELEPFITSVGVMKEDNRSWGRMSSFFSEETRTLHDTSGENIQLYTDKFRQHALIS